MSPLTQRLIDESGDQAYHQCIELTVVATHFGDDVMAQQYAESAKELMQLGYHKKEKKVDG